MGGTWGQGSTGQVSFQLSLEGVKGISLDRERKGVLLNGEPYTVFSRGLTGPGTGLRKVTRGQLVESAEVSRPGGRRRSPELLQRSGLTRTVEACDCRDRRQSQDMPGSIWDWRVQEMKIRGSG